MSKLRLLNVEVSRLPTKQSQRLKCGEIFYDCDDGICSFQLVCFLCKIIHFAFEDFAIHIQNVHSKCGGLASFPTAEAEPQPLQDNCLEFLPEDVSDEEDPIGNTDYKPLRSCTFNDNESASESEPEPEANESCDDDLHSEFEMDTTTATAREPSDFHENSESEAEKQHVFKVGYY